MPHLPHRGHRDNDQANELHRGHVPTPSHDATRTTDLDAESPLQRAVAVSAVRPGTLPNLDGAGRARLVTTLQRTVGNAHVQRLIAQTNHGYVHRCGGTPCNCASDDDGGRSIQRLGQPAEELQPPRGATMAASAAPPRREEDEHRR